MSEKIAVIGLGYVGLPLALAFSKKYEHTVGFDINQKRVSQLLQGVDESGETDSALIKESRVILTSDPVSLRACSFIIVGVPTPIDANHKPDLTPLISASKTIGANLSKGAVIVFESTVYPSVTEKICGPVIAEASGLELGVDFKLGYSPERINPGDKEHSLDRVVKIVSGQDAETLERVATVYSSIVSAGVYRAPSIQVAEAAKVIENTQRDLNIALMNELAIIFDRMDISTAEVLKAAGTKWNFLHFTPGLVGGHCIGVDPNYLTTKAELLGYHPQVILAGRRINDNMGVFIANKAVKLMINSGIPVAGAKVGVFGLTFKENVRDIRNSRVPDIISELAQFGVTALVWDPLVDSDEVKNEYGIQLSQFEDMKELDALIIAVAHRNFASLGEEGISKMLKPKSVIIDVKSKFDSTKLPATIKYWSL